MTDLTAASLCAGIGGFDEALRRAGIPVAAAVEIEPACRGVLARHFPETALFPDVTEVTGDQLRAAGFDPARGVLTSGWPCFPAGTRILAERGWLPVEDVRVGDVVLTHRGRWMPVTATMSRISDHLIHLRGHGLPRLATTSEHPFWARSQSRKQGPRPERRWQRTFSEPEWTEAAKMAGQFASQVLPPVEESEHGVDLWWLVGRFLADGWSSESNGKPRVQICSARGEADDLATAIHRVGLHATRVEMRTATRFSIHRKWFAELVAPLGRGAAFKTLTRRELALDQARAEALLSGWLSGDGSRDERIRAWKGTTVSRSLAMSIALLAQRARGVVAIVTETPMPSKKVIDGREIGQRTQYQVVIPDRNRSGFIEGDYGWKLVRRAIRTDGSVLVYNLSVGGDESYIADGAIVHNCQGNSKAGRRGGMDDPRSGLWRHVVRLVAETRPRWFLGENVPGLLGINDGRDFWTVVRDLEELGYGVAWRVLDAQFFGLAQGRERLFIAGCLGDGAAPVEVLLEPESGSGDPAPRCAEEPDPARRRPGGAGNARRLVVSTLQGGGRRGHRIDAEGAAGGHLIVLPGGGVRRLTPLEWERLQGFPDDWTRWLADGREQSDSARYRQAGNAVAVPVAEWITRRIAAVDAAALAALEGAA